MVTLYHVWLGNRFCLILQSQGPKVEQMLFVCIPGVYLCQPLPPCFSVTELWTYLILLLTLILWLKLRHWRADWQHSRAHHCDTQLADCMTYTCILWNCEHSQRSYHHWHFDSPMQQWKSSPHWYWKDEGMSQGLHKTIPEIKIKKQQVWVQNIQCNSISAIKNILFTSKKH